MAKVMSAEYFQGIGKDLIRTKEYGAALYALNKSLSLDTSDGWTHLYIGNIYFAQQDYVTALNSFLNATKLIGLSAAPYWCVADAYIKLGKLDNAEENYRRAVQIDHESEEAAKRLKHFLSAKNNL